MALELSLAQQTALTLARVQSHLQARFAEQAAQQPAEWDAFHAHLREHFPPLFKRLLQLYGTRYDFFYHLEELAAILAEAFLARPAALRALDARRERDPQWFQSNQMLGGVCYIDLFAGNLAGIRAKIPYFLELGLTYLHLMPLFQAPEPENDGGYAVSSYREVNPPLGAMAQLRELADALHEAGIALTVDFVFNHTANDHIWAQRALAGDPEYASYYLIFPDRTLPDAYDRTLREIFPDVRRGSFTFVPSPPPSPLAPLPEREGKKAGRVLPPSPVERGGQSGDGSLVRKNVVPAPQEREFRHPSPSGRGAGGQGQHGSEGQSETKGVWVWTTFHSFQWDLNYRNPAVFNSMAREMLFLANQGIDVLRLDAVAFIWKQLGTSSENLPEAHVLIQAFNALARIAAPGLLFKSEAIVHPDDVIKYISPDECQLSYNPLLMALLWNSLATGKVRLLTQAVEKRFALPSGTTWVNYVRVHDDIGWTFSDEDAWALGINGQDHRRFLNNFYTGKFPGSFARGLPFQANPDTGDLRISGTAASLAGLEKALADGNAADIELAIRRILLLYGIVLLIGGIPLIYLGDEIGTLNDYAYAQEPAKQHDSRWAHRPKFDWTRAALRHDATTIPGRVYGGLQELIALRKTQPAVADGNLRVRPTGNDHLLAVERPGADSPNSAPLLILANFSPAPQRIFAEPLRAAVQQLAPIYGAGALAENAVIAPYGLVVLR